MPNRRRLRSALICLTVVAAVGAVAAPAGSATPPGKNGKIAFVRDFDLDESDSPCRESDLTCIYTMRADGKRVRALARGDNPVFSPSGKLLAFSREVGDEEPIFTVTAAGDDRRRVPGSRKNLGLPLAWSPDGRQIAFTTNEERSGVYSLAARGGSAPRRLTRDLHDGDQVGDWSSRGTVVFSSMQDGGETECDATRHAQLFTTGTFAGRPQPLFPELAATDDGNWSPDGRLIAFAADARWSASEHASARAADGDECGWGGPTTPNYDIYVARAGGERPLRLTRRGGHSPVWSPDGEKIAFVRGSYLWVMDADGENEQELAEGHSPDWQPR